ncbi:unnamed protein product [Trichobilharzia szidati]|nr:unnamed protein product [Trichobilharzia szidati]
MNALIQISKEKMLIMPKRVNWSLATTNNHKNLTIHQKFIDVNNLIKSSSSSSPSSNLINKESIEHTHVCTSDPNDNMADINHIKSSSNNNNHNNKNNGNNKGVDSHDAVHCNGYIRDWVGLSIDDKGGCEQNDDLMLNNISNSQCLPVPTTTVNGDHVNSCHDNCQTGSIRIAFVRRESSECGNSIAPHFIQNKYSPAKLRRSRLRGTDHLVIKFKRNSLSKDYYPNEIVTNSFAQSVCDKFCNYNSNNNNTLSTPSTVTASNNPTDTTTTDTIASITSANNNNNNCSTDKQRIRCDQNKILCILTSPLNYSSNYYPRNTCYDSNRLLSPTTLTSSSIASRVKWGANLTLQTNYTSANHDTNGIKVSSPIISQYNSEINSKESNQYFNSFNNLSSVMMRKATHDEFDKIILHPRPRIPPKRLDLANQDLELALKRSLSDCTMQVSNKRYYNNSIKKSLAYTARIKNQHNTNRESTNENLARRRKTVLRTKRRRHRPFTTRRQKSRSGNIKIPHKFTGDSVTTMSADNSFTSIYSSQSISDDSLLNESDEKNKTINGQISRLPLPKLTLAKNRDGEFNVVENREENTVKGISDATDEEYKPATQRITNSTSNDSESTDVSDSYTPVNNSLGNTTELCKSSKRKCVNKQRTNCLSNKRMKNRTSQESSEDDQKSNADGSVYDLNSEEVKQDMNAKHNLSSCVSSSEGIKTTQCEIPNVVVTPSQSVNSLSNSSAFLPELTITPRVEESKNSPICFTTVESVQSGANNLPVSSYFPSTNNAIPSSHPICSTSSNQSFTYLSPIQPVTMWSRLASPLPAPDPPTKLFNTKRIPAHHQSVNNNNNKCQPFPMIIPANSVVCGNQMTSQLPQYLTPNPNRTSIPIPIHSTTNLPSDVLFNRNANMNLSGLTTNPVHFNSTFCNNFPSLNDLNSKQILQNCNKIQLTNQGCSSSFPNAAIHPSLPPVGLPLQQQQQQAPLRLPTQLPHSLSFPYAAPSSSSSSSAYTFNGNQTSWSSSIDQFINHLSNPYISNISENIPVCYGTSVVLPPGNSVLNTNPTHNINSSNCNNQNNFVSYPFFIPHPILRNISQSNNNPSLSTPVPGSYPASLQSVLGTSFMLGGQNYNNNNTTNVQNYAWIPPSF